MLSDEKLHNFIQDSTYVFVDPQHSSLGYVVAYLQDTNSEVTIEYASRIHKELIGSESWPEEKIKSTFDDWEHLGYIKKGPQGGYQPTGSMQRALETIGATPEIAHALAQSLELGTKPQAEVYQK